MINSANALLQLCVVVFSVIGRSLTEFCLAMTEFFAGQLGHGDRNNLLIFLALFCFISCLELLNKYEANQDTKKFLKLGHQIKSSLYSRYYAETCNEWRVHLRNLVPGLHSSEETSQR